MKIRNSTCLRHITLLIFPVILAGLSSCDNDETNIRNAEQQAFARTSTTTAHQILVSIQEVLDISTNMLSEEGISIEGASAWPVQCPPVLHRKYLADYTHYDTIIYVGTIVMDYGFGLDCANVETRRQGKISDFFTYIINTENKLTENNHSSSVRQTITLDNYKRDTVQFDGKLTYLSATGEPDKITSNGSKITYENGYSILWNGTLTNLRHTTGTENPSTRTINGTIQGATSDGKHFNANILAGITYSYDCSGSNALIPLKGIVEITTGSFTVTVNYGDGTCDRTYTVTMNNNAVTHSF